jgi:hypothetical protein
MVSYSKIKRDFNQSMFGNHPGNVSMDSNQAGATMASRFIVAKNAAIIGASVVPVGAIARTGSMVTGSKAYKIYGAIKRPILTVGVHQKIRGATTAMSLSKAYSKMALTAGVLNFGRNLQLARQKEYKRLGINVFGPPLSLFLYDNYMDRNKTSEDETASVADIQSGVGGSLPSKPETPGKHSYVPSPSRYLAYYEGGKGNHEDSICRKGYRYVAKSGTLGMCVRK